MADYRRIGSALSFGWSHSFPCAGTAACSPLKSRAPSIPQNGDYTLPLAERLTLEGSLSHTSMCVFMTCLESLERERQSFATNCYSVCRAVLAPCQGCLNARAAAYTLPFGSSFLDIIKASLYYKTTQQLQQWSSLTYTVEPFSYDQPTLTTDRLSQQSLSYGCAPGFCLQWRCAPSYPCWLPYVFMYLFLINM